MTAAAVHKPELACPAALLCALRISAAAAAIWKLVAGDEDIGSPMFEHMPIIDGDTGPGLRLTNTLVAIGPLVSAFPREYDSGHR